MTWWPRSVKSLSKEGRRWRRGYGGRLDDIYCGSGDADRASVDEEDAVSNCEFVNGEPVETSADN